MIFQRFTFILIIIFGLSACNEEAKKQTTEAQKNSVAEVKKETYEWNLVTSWPKSFPGLGMAPERFANLVKEMSDGQLTIKVYGAGELVPGFAVFDTVATGKTAQMGHSAAYYWKGKVPAAQVFGAVPFGMNAQEMNAWLNYGGGIELWRTLYAPFGIEPMPGGNTGQQASGWYKKPINTVDDLSGLKMRIPGLAGEVLKKLGVIPVSMAGGELFTALQSGSIDAAEWVGPYNDISFGLYKAASHYYFSSWHEPGAQMEFLINTQAMQALPEHLQAIVRVAGKAVNQDMLAEYTVRNMEGMIQLAEEHNIQIKELSPEIIQALKQATQETMAEWAQSDPSIQRVWNSYQKFYQNVKQYHALAEQAYYKNR